MRNNPVSYPYVYITSFPPPNKQPNILNNQFPLNWDEKSKSHGWSYVCTILTSTTYYFIPFRQPPPEQSGCNLSSLSVFEGMAARCLTEVTLLVYDRTKLETISSHARSAPKPNAAPMTSSLSITGLFRASDVILPSQLLIAWVV